MTVEKSYRKPHDALHAELEAVSQVLHEPPRVKEIIYLAAKIWTDTQTPPDIRTLARDIM